MEGLEPVIDWLQGKVSHVRHWSFVVPKPCGPLGVDMLITHPGRCVAPHTDEWMKMSRMQLSDVAYLVCELFPSASVPHSYHVYPIRMPSRYGIRVMLAHEMRAMQRQHCLRACAAILGARIEGLTKDARVLLARACWSTRTQQGQWIMSPADSIFEIT